MAKGSNTFGGTLKLQGQKEYREAIKSINSDLKVMASEMKKVVAQFGNNQSSTEALTAKQKVLSEQYDTQKGKVDAYRAAVEKLEREQSECGFQVQKLSYAYEDAKSQLDTMKKSTSSTSEEIEKQENRVHGLEVGLEKANNQYNANERSINEWKTNLNKAEAELYKLNNELEDNEKDLKDSEEATRKGYNSLEDYRKAAEDAGKSTLSFGDIIKANLASDAILSGVKALGSAVKKLGSALIDVGKSAIESYADYEQLIGGVETLFKNSAAVVENYANNAYRTAGLSANEYMETVTSFSASLLQSLGNDTKKAAEVADMAITDMADNANKMGTDMASIQNAYQGFAKANYTMLDNLKLGYGGTKEEMARLLEDAEKISGIEYDISSLNDIYQAIHVIQGEMGITGTTAKEASTTIQGSVSSMKSAWQNMLIGMANDNADFDGLVNNLVDSIATAAENLLPRAEVVIEGIVQLIMSLVEKLAEQLPTLLETGRNMMQNIINGIAENMPAILSTGKEVLTSLIQGIVSDLPNLVTTIVSLVVSMADTFVSNIGTIVDMGISLIFALVDGIIQSLPTLIAEVPRIINDFWNAFDKNLWKIIKAGGQLIVKLGKGIIDSIPVIIANAGQIVKAIVNTILHINMLNMGKNLIKNLGSGLKSMGGSISTAAKELLNKLLHPFKSTATFREIGRNMINGIISGLKSMAGGLISAGKNAVSGLVGGVKSFLGIKSPSRVFRDQVGKFMALGLSEGFINEMSSVAKKIQNSIPTDFDMDLNAKVNGSMSSMGYNTSDIGGSAYGGLVMAFREAMNGMKVVLDDDEVGRIIIDKMEGVLV